VVATSTFSPLAARLLLWAGVAALLAVAVFFLVRFFGGEGTASESPSNPITVPAQNSEPPHDALERTDIGKEARLVAGKFILTAVARRNLGASWKYVHPALKAGYTLREWRQGEIPIVPYPIGGLDQARFRVDYNQGDTIQLKVALIPKKGVDVDAATFDLGLRRVGTRENTRWLVDYWMPYAPQGLPEVPVR
jgi:hypothetical protein